MPLYHHHHHHSLSFPYINITMCHIVSCHMGMQPLWHHHMKHTHVCDGTPQLWAHQSAHWVSLTWVAFVCHMMHDTMPYHHSPIHGGSMQHVMLGQHGCTTTHLCPTPPPQHVAPPTCGETQPCTTSQPNGKGAAHTHHHLPILGTLTISVVDYHASHLTLS